ncbi:P-loop containing nucleoside triphosphate hydrolase protein, partial [Armillaria solidipes]
GTPVLATSVTLNPTALRDVCSELLIMPESSFFLNLGNDHPNISMSVHRMKSASDYDTLKLHLNLQAMTPEKLPKTIIFMNTIKAAQHGCRFIKNPFPEHMHDYIDCMYAHRSYWDKRKVVQRFWTGKVCILIATEAAGMGADIPDIEVTIQFGIPSSLSVFKQHIGHAGRSPDICACAILLVEEK